MLLISRSEILCLAVIEISTLLVAKGRRNITSIRNEWKTEAGQNAC